MPLPLIEPPLINSANPWATTTDDLQALFDCTHTGAVTTRTSLLRGFEHNDDVHQFAFFEPTTHRIVGSGSVQGSGQISLGSGSLNTLGYSPLLFNDYLKSITNVVKRSSLPEPIRNEKPFIISVTGSIDAIIECFHRITATQQLLQNPLCMEINLSCPNIPGKPPPAYSGYSLVDYLQAISGERAKSTGRQIAVGIKTPPYTYQEQFDTLIQALLSTSAISCPVDFITSTNTLGSCLVLNNTEQLPALKSAAGTGIGGLAGAPLHPLALGNVRTIRSMLDGHSALQSIDIIGVGGVSDTSGFRRMMAVGSKVVGVGTALGIEGVGVFSKIVS